MNRGVLLLAFSCCLSLSAQDFSKTNAVADFEFLRGQIIQYQPTLPLYTPDFKMQADSLISAVDGPLNRFEYFQMLSKLICLAGEGHFSVGQWDDTIHSGFGDNSYAQIPLNVYLLDRNIYVREDLSLNGLQLGDEVLSINGKAAYQVVQELSGLIPVDGDIVTYARHQLAGRFMWFYYLGMEQPDQFQLGIRRADSSWQVTIPALTRAEMIENVKLIRERDQMPVKKDDQDVSSFFELEFRDSIAHLRLKSFSRSLMEQFDLKAKKFYRNVFAEIEEEGAAILIIDLRGNSGGRLEFETEILPYVMKDAPVDYYRMSRSWEGKERYYRQKKKPGKIFTGEIYVFIDGASFSAGSTLARYLREYGQATLIGEESGSRYEGYAAGSKQYVTLPNSRMRIGIPRYAILYPTSEKQTTSNRGVIPDIEVNPDIQDLLRGDDAYLRALDELLQQKNP